MTWQEYQDAVGELYERLDDLGTVLRSVTIPDKVTGQPRQLDVLVEMGRMAIRCGWSSRPAHINRLVKPGLRRGTVYS